MQHIIFEGTRASGIKDSVSIEMLMRLERAVLLFAMLPMMRLLYKLD